MKTLRILTLCLLSALTAVRGANVKITDLPELTTAATGDLLEIVDVSASASKKITLANLSLILAPPFSNLTGTPTTLAGYGVTTVSGVTISVTTAPTVTIAGLGTTGANGLLLTNTTAAAAGAQQISPALNWTGQGWKTTATAASQAVAFRAYVLPVQGSTNPTGNWLLESSINGGAYSTVATISSAGVFTPANRVVVSTAGVGAVNATETTQAAITGTSSSGNGVTAVSSSGNAIVATSASGIPFVAESQDGTYAAALAFFGNTDDDGLTVANNGALSWTVEAAKTTTRQNLGVDRVEFIVALSDETTAITTGTAKVTMRAPYAFTVTGVRASVNTVSSSGIPTVDINEAGTTILSTKLTIDASEKTSTTAATAAVISDTAIADDAELTFDIDVAGTGAKGLKVIIYGSR